MTESTERARLRRHLDAHLVQLGYSTVRLVSNAALVPEIVRVSPVRGRIAYGETVVRSDLKRKQCHERLLAFSQRRTRRRNTILFFIGVSEADEAELRALLAELDIQNGTRGGHVQVVPIPDVTPQRRRATPRAVCG